jgi:hypothetical protein
LRERNDIRTRRAFQIVGCGRSKELLTTKGTKGAKSLGYSGSSKGFFVFFVPFVVKSSFDSYDLPH